MHQKTLDSCAANRVNLLKREPSKLSLTIKRYKAGMDNEFRSENFGSQCPDLNRLIAVVIVISLTQLLGSTDSTPKVEHVSSCNQQQSSKRNIIEILEDCSGKSWDKSLLLSLVFSDLGD